MLISVVIGSGTFRLLSTFISEIPGRFSVGMIQSREHLRLGEARVAINVWVSEARSIRNALKGRHRGYEHGFTVFSVLRSKIADM